MLRGEVVIDTAELRQLRVKHHPGLQQRHRIGIDVAVVNRPPLVVCQQRKRRRRRRRVGTLPVRVETDARNRVLLEQVLDTKREPALLEHRHDADGQDGVAAETEEVVGDADARSLPQHLLPHLGECLLDCGARRDVDGRRAAARIRRGERLPVDLAVVRQRQSVESNEQCRDHVLRQCGCQPFAAGRCQLALSAR